MTKIANISKLESNAFQRWQSKQFLSF